jgi:8-amino-7-oxononanoate synthase
MIDFTSALYLGMHHSWRSLKPWISMTTGKPAVLEESSSTADLQNKLTRFCNSSTLLSSSTLHLAWDIFSIFNKNNTVLLYDRSAYPILRWGCEFARCKGFEAYEIGHHDPDSIKKTINDHKVCLDKKRPVIVCDSYCTGCGSFSPLAKYYSFVNLFDGFIICDDTQTFGIFGSSPNQFAPYGTKGNGIGAWLNIPRYRYILLSSMQKGYGVPCAFISANQSIIRSFLHNSKARTHCSSPSSAAIASGLNAIHLEDLYGSAMRSHLYHRVSYFRKCFRDYNIPLLNTIFPLQTIRLTHRYDIVTLHRLLKLNSIQSLLHHHCTSFLPQISFAITLSTTRQQIEYTASVIARLLHNMSPQHHFTGIEYA